MAGGMDLDAAGNILVAGAFDLSATFGPGETGQTSFTAVGYLDAFLAKYDNDGNLIWARTAGGLDLSYTQGVGVDGSGGSCISGIFTGSMRFGPSDVINSAGGDDIYLAKYDVDGRFLWAHNIGGSGRDQGYDATADVFGNCYVSGEISDTVVVDPGGPNETTLTTSEAGTDVFVAKHDSSGVLQWARSATGSNCVNGRELGRHIEVDDSGDVRLAGYFCSAPAIFGAGESSETSLSSAGSLDIFAARYDTSGNLLWASRAGGPGVDQGVDVASDKLGNTYVTGRFDDFAVFGPGEANETSLASAGVYDIFTAKYDGAGDLLWVRPAGGAVDDHGAGIDVDRLGDAYVTGNFASEFAVFGFGEVNETLVFSKGGYDGFLATFESTALEKIALLINEIRILQASGAIGDTEANRLVLTLLWAQGSLERGTDNIAVVALRIYSFLARVYVAMGAIPPSDGQWLIDAGDIIIEQINRTG